MTSPLLDWTPRLSWVRTHIHAHARTHILTCKHNPRSRTLTCTHTTGTQRTYLHASIPIAHACSHARIPLAHSAHTYMQAYISLTLAQAHAHIMFAYQLDPDVLNIISYYGFIIFKFFPPYFFSSYQRARAIHLSADGGGSRRGGFIRQRVNFPRVFVLFWTTHLTVKAVKRVSCGFIW